MQRYDWNSEDGYMARYDDGLYVLHSDAQAEIARLTAERDQALARAADAAMEMRDRAAQEMPTTFSYNHLSGRIRTLPIDPDAQKALDRLLAKAREDAIREAAELFTHIEAYPVKSRILALLNEGGRDE